MDRTQLDRLASEGFAAFPPERLDALARWCGDHSWPAGDARYAVLQDLFQLVDDAYAGPLLPATEQAMSTVITRDLPALLDEEDPEVARVMAVSMRSEILDLLRDQELEGP